MNRPAFFDTNILVYTDDEDFPEKQKRALDLFESYRTSNLAILSLQVLQEYFVTATRKLGIDAEHAQRKVEVLARGRVIRFTERDVIASIELHRL